MHGLLWAMYYVRPFCESSFTGITGLLPTCHDVVIAWHVVVNQDSFEASVVPSYPCDKQGFCNRVLDFFPVNKFVHRTHLDSWNLAS